MKGHCCRLENGAVIGFGRAGLSEHDVEGLHSVAMYVNIGLRLALHELF